MTLNKENMTLKRFRAIIAAYGVNPERWPAAERTTAKSFLTKNPEVQKLLGAASGLDTILDTALKPTAADAGFLKRVATIPYQEHALSPTVQKQTTFGEFIRSLFPARSLAAQGMALAFAGILGVWLGVFTDLQPEAQVIQLDAGKYLFENPDLKKDFKEFQ